MANDVLTGRDVWQNAVNSGKAQVTARELAQQTALQLWSGTSTEIADRLTGLLDDMVRALRSHTGQRTNRFVFTDAYMARVREDIAALSQMTVTGTAEYSRLLDDLRAHFAQMTAQVPASVQTLDSVTGKRVRNTAASAGLREMRTYGSLSLRMAPAYMPQAQVDELALIDKARADKAQAQTERDRARLNDAVTAARATLAGLPQAATETERDAATQAVADAQEKLDAFNAAHPLAITGTTN